MKPNLFSLAIKELSQDAFIAWLLQWADPRCREHNPALNAVACEFVNRLISLQGTAPAQLTRVEAGRQWENIDVWAEVNDSHLIVIEDKVGTGQHSDQLARYRKIGEEWCREHGCQLICVYIKTYSDSSSNLKLVAEQGFAVFSRRDLFEMLCAHEVNSDIYNDFRDRLREIVDSESQFDTKKLGDWGAGDWKGFYQRLEVSRSIENWFWVNPPGGNGFWSLILNGFERNGYSLYMQIEQGNLCFKVGEVDDDRSQVRTVFHHFLMKAGGSEIGLQRPGRFGSGTYMTVAIVPRSVWLGEDDQLLDFDATLTRLNSHESWLVGVIDCAEQSPVETTLSF